MYTINGEKFHSSRGIENLVKEIKSYLHKNQLILVDSKGIPLSEEEITHIITINPSYNFDTICISEVELEFIKEMLDYVEKVEKNFSEISQSNNNEIIINSFIDLINSLMEIVKVAEHFKIDFITIEKINEIANKSMSRIEKGDIEFVIDVMEYEIIPTLLDFKSILLERQNH